MFARLGSDALQPLPFGVTHSYTYTATTHPSAENNAGPENDADADATEINAHAVSLSAKTDTDPRSNSTKGRIGADPDGDTIKGDSSTFALSGEAHSNSCVNSSETDRHTSAKNCCGLSTEADSDSRADSAETYGHATAENCCPHRDHPAAKNNLDADAAETGSDLCSKRAKGCRDADATSAETNPHTGASA